MDQKIVLSGIKWAEQTYDRLGLLSTAVTGNEKALNGLHFFIWLGDMDQKIVLKRY